MKFSTQIRCQAPLSASAEDPARRRDPPHGGNTISLLLRGCRPKLLLRGRTPRSVSEAGLPFLRMSPDLTRAPMPKIPRGLQNRYAVRHFATLDCGRGCPYQCSFCTVINVQGRAMRFRSVEGIMRMIRENYQKYKISYYFFTDDNFSRNKNWRAIFDALIELRKEEGIDVRFMIQVDTQSHHIPDFAEKAAEAGCSQVFIGLESINEHNLQLAGKKQNKVQEFKGMIDLYQGLGVTAHLAYIIGFPFDTEESVTRDMARLQQEFGARQASFFMLTPLPGSMDHKEALSRNMAMDADLNNFDSFHQTFKHGAMTQGAWPRVYAAAWKSFYGIENMIRILKSIPRKKYWDILLNFFWYKNAIQAEGGHPMLHGFFRLKNRHDRRPSFGMEGRLEYLKRRLCDVGRLLREWCRIVFEMEEVWLATHPRSPLEEKVVSELADLHKRAREWRSLRLSELQELYRRASSALPTLSISRHSVIPSRIQLWFQKQNLFSNSLTYSRSFMTRFWKVTFKRLRKGKLFRPMPFHRITIMMCRECILFFQLLYAVLSSAGVIPGKQYRRP